MIEVSDIEIIVFDDMHHFVIGHASKSMAEAAECIKRMAIEGAPSFIVVLVGRPFPHD